MSKKLKDSVLFDLLPNCMESSKDHYLSDCLVCGKQGHFYINRNTQLWDCKKCKGRGNIFILLKTINKLDLLFEEGFVYYKEELEKKILTFKSDFSINDEDLKLKKISLPIGYRRIFSDSYLESRGILDFENEEYGKTKLKSDLKDYIIMPIYEDNICVGYLSRSTKSKSEIQIINDAFKEAGVRKKYLRWRNCADMDAKKILDGFDEVLAFQTNTVILVEGRFARLRIKNFLHYSKDFNYCVCNATLGKGCSEFQIYKLLQKGVKNIILMYDADAVEEIKDISFELQHYFTSSNIAVIDEGDDIDDMNDEKISHILTNLKTPFQYFNTQILKREL